MSQTVKVQCCIVGGGPAGMMLGYLMGRAGVKTIVLEKHGDFLRDFRGDTVHPSTLNIMSELGLLEDFLKRPHSRAPAVSAQIGDQTFKVADFSRLPGPCKFMAFMPQWDFLNFLRQKGAAFPALEVRLQAEVKDLKVRNGRVTGVQVNTAQGPLEVDADLVVGCDGRGSKVRERSGLEVQDLGSPIDVLWFRLSKKDSDPQDVLGRLGRGKMIVTIDRDTYWQCAFVIQKGGYDAIRAKGLEAFRRSVADGARFLEDRLVELHAFDDIKLLSVSLDRLNAWSKPGLLCIGDAAHAMSPVGGVGINLAIQDAVAAANLLADKLQSGRLKDEDLGSVRRRRLFPVKVIQSGQAAIHKHVLKPALTEGDTPLQAPWPIRLLDRHPQLRRWPAQLIGLGVRPEHVRSKIA